MRIKHRAVPSLHERVKSPVKLSVAYRSITSNQAALRVSSKSNNEAALAAA